MIAWTVYAALVGVLVAGSAWAAERLMGSTGRPTRIPWLVGLGLALVVPAVGRPGPAELPALAIDSAPGRGIGPEPAASVVPPIDAWALVGWLAVSCLALLWIGTVVVVAMQARRSWSRERVAATDVLVSHRFGPGLVGIVRPAIVLPAWALEMGTDRLEMIVRHEAEHRRARDHLALFFGGVVLALLVWSPAVWWMFYRLRAAVEIDCDQRVLASGIGMRDYGKTLLDVGARANRGWGFVPALTEPRSLLERRLRTMGKRGKKLGPGASTALACGAGILLVVACETPAPTALQEVFDDVLAETDAGELAGTLTPGDPLIYVDGVRIDQGPGSLKDGSVLSQLRPESIERVEVLKGGAAKRLYGPEAAAGVIQIFTKERQDEEAAAEKATLQRKQTTAMLEEQRTRARSAEAVHRGEREMDASVRDMERKLERMRGAVKEAERTLARARADRGDPSVAEVVRRQLVELQRRAESWWRERRR